MTNSAARVAASQAVENSTAVNELLARTLSLLGVSSWFPSIAATVGVVFLHDLHQSDDFGVYGAAETLAGSEWQRWVGIALAVVLVNVVTQPFQYSMIRAMEGYWAPNRATRAASRALVNRHVRKRAGLNKRRLQLARKRDGETGKASPSLERDLEAVRRSFFDYPKQERVMPTRLGNVLRSFEDRASTVAGVPMETWIGHVIATSPDRIVKEHDMHRLRLDMYVHLFFVWLTGLIAAVALVVVAVAGELALNEVWVDAVVLVALLTTLGLVARSAALRSTAAYGSALVSLATDFTSREPGD